MATSISSDTDGGIGAMLDLGNQQTDEQINAADAMQANVSRASLDAQKNTGITGIEKMISAMAEGVAKTGKAGGESVKGLC